MGFWRGGFRFRDEVRLVRDELTVNAEDALERAVDLGGSVVLRLQLTYRGVNQHTQGGNIREDGMPDMNARLHGT